MRVKICMVVWGGVWPKPRLSTLSTMSLVVRECHPKVGEVGRKWVMGRAIAHFRCQRVELSAEKSGARCLITEVKNSTFRMFWLQNR